MNRKTEMQKQNCEKRKTKIRIAKQKKNMKAK